VSIRSDLCQSEVTSVECSLTAASYKLHTTSYRRHTKQVAEKGKSSNGEEITYWQR